jgi:acyl-coenzyme A thioesterase PaaI-like protein
MDATALARSILEPIPAHRTAGLRVLRAADGAAEIELVTPAALANVIGSLHSSGLTTLADAAGLAAIIAAVSQPGDIRGVLPLGVAAALEFRAPARGRLVAACRLDEEARQALAPLLAGQQDPARLSTAATVTDESGTVVGRGRFDWSIRRVSRLPGQDG